MLLGTYRLNLIGKNRLTLPMKLRKELAGNRLVLTIGFEECVMGFEEKKWEEVTASDLSRPLSDSVGRDLRRKMCTEAMVIALDSQGRFVVPEVMMEYSGIKNKLTIIGAGDHFEIWDNERWDVYRQGLDKQKVDGSVS